MKKLLFLVTVLVQSLLSAQSNTETENWIKQKIEMYGLETHDIKHTYSIEFNDSSVNDKLERIMFIGHELYGLGDPYSTIMEIQVNQIGWVLFEDKKNNIWLKINCLNNNDCISVRYVDENEYSFNDDTLSNSMTLIFSKTMEKDDMPNRLKKAFNHLISTNGGMIVKEVF